MHSTLTTLLLPLFALTTSTTAAIIAPRVPLIGSFGVSQQSGCPLGPQLIFQFAVGDGCGDCRSFYNATETYASINQYSMNPQCVLTVFNTFDCSDPGIQSGPGCWTPEGGIRAYKVSCPWWPEDAYFKACGHPV
ncbi:hypothetical protein B0T17DRAFT_614647 [Bombardia bombarda]|uniref:Uncharacterized protein n=1 Tax=Bombardia bombarda TaxID=252184 RepID=A0AA39X7J6_9PEZI|nr:hypothetical protein B0T17DRAFT_614647 [Bombardia bombarda]